MVFVCTPCGRTFKRKWLFDRHMDRHNNVEYACTVAGCPEVFTRKDVRVRHEENQHGIKKLRCRNCKGLVRKDAMDSHQKGPECRRRTGMRRQAASLPPDAGPSNRITQRKLQEDSRMTVSSQDQASPSTATNCSPSSSPQTWSPMTAAELSSAETSPLSDHEYAVASPCHALNSTDRHESLQFDHGTMSFPLQRLANCEKVQSMSATEWNWHETVTGPEGMSLEHVNSHQCMGFTPAEHCALNTEVFTGTVVEYPEQINTVQLPVNHVSTSDRADQLSMYEPESLWNNASFNTFDASLFDTSAIYSEVHESLAVTPLPSVTDQADPTNFASDGQCIPVDCMNINADSFDPTLLDWVDFNYNSSTMDVYQLPQSVDYPGEDWIEDTSLHDTSRHQISHDIGDDGPLARPYRRFNWGNLSGFSSLHMREIESWQSIEREHQRDQASPTMTLPGYSIGGHLAVLPRHDVNSLNAVPNRIENSRRAKTRHFACPNELCSSAGRFRERYELERHKRTKHLSSKLFQCHLPGCRIPAFARADKFGNHLRREHCPDRTARFDCLSDQYNKKKDNPLGDSGPTHNYVSEARARRFDCAFSPSGDSSVKVSDRLLAGNHGDQQFISELRRFDQMHITALHAAASAGHMEIVRILLANDANPERQSEIIHTGATHSATGTLPFADYHAQFRYGLDHLLCSLEALHSRFSTKRDRDTHVRMHHPKRWYCPWADCTKRFHLETHAQEHLAWHSLNDIRRSNHASRARNTPTSCDRTLWDRFFYLQLISRKQNASLRYKSFDGTNPGYYQAISYSWDDVPGHKILLPERDPFFAPAPAMKVDAARGFGPYFGTSWIDASSIYRANIIHQSRGVKAIGNVDQFWSCNAVNGGPLTTASSHHQHFQPVYAAQYPFGGPMPRNGPIIAGKITTPSRGKVGTYEKATYIENSRAETAATVLNTRASTRVKATTLHYCPSASHRLSLNGFDFSWVTIIFGIFVILLAIFSLGIGDRPFDTTAYRVNSRRQRRALASRSGTFCKKKHSSFEMALSGHSWISRALTRRLF